MQDIDDKDSNIAAVKISLSVEDAQKVATYLIYALERKVDHNKDYNEGYNKGYNEGLAARYDLR
jgi:hypothetical protein